MSLQELEGMAAEEYHRLYDRYTIGHAQGLRQAVLSARSGEDLDTVIREVLERQRTRGQRDAYDLGYVDALRTATQVLAR